MADLKLKAIDNIFIFKKENNLKIFAYVACFVYLAYLFKNALQYFKLLWDYFTKDTNSSNALSYLEALTGEYPPDIYEVIIRSVHMLVLLSLIVYVIATFCTRWRKITYHVIRVDFFVSGLSVLLFSFGLLVSLRNRTMSPYLIVVIYFLITLGTAGLLFYLGKIGYKKKTSAIVYAVLIILMLIEKIFLFDSLLISVIDVIFFILFSILGANWEHFSKGESQSDLNTEEA